MTLTIISGASRGIGRAIAEDLMIEIDSEFLLLDSSVVDFEDHLAVFDHMENYLKDKEYDQINIILCAAQIGTYGSLATEEIEKLFKINVLGNLNIIESAVYITLCNKFRIVWFSGGGAAYPYPDFMGYSLSKVAVVRAVENLSITLKESCNDISIIALAPGAVDTDMLKIATEHGCEVRTRTDISEPVNFVRRFITDDFDSRKFNGMFLHVRDDVDNFVNAPNIYKLRRIE